MTISHIPIDPFSRFTQVFRLLNKATFRVGMILFAITAVGNNAQAWRVLETHRISDGTTVMCSVNDDLWCGSRAGDSTITVLNGATGEVIRLIDAPTPGCKGIAYHAGSIWYVGDTHIYRMNRDGEVQGVMNVPFAGMTGLASGDNGLWTVDRSDGEPALVFLNLQGGVLRRVAMRVTDAMDLHFDGSYFWISSPPDGFIHKLNAEGSPVNIYPTPANGPTAIAMIDTALYLIDNGDEQNDDVLYVIGPSNAASPRILPGAYLHSYGLVNITGNLFWDLSIFNVGRENLLIDRVFLRRGDQGFARGQLPQNLTVNPGQYLLVRITFSPRDYGTVADTLVITSNDPIDSVLSVTCLGTGVYPERRLGKYPASLNFGDVRADPERDGSRHLEMFVFNMGADPLLVEDISNHIPDIFSIEMPELPYELRPIDSLAIRIWFTPHRAIDYIDTVIVTSTGIFQYELVTIRGHGDGRVYGEGEILWRSDNGEGEHGGAAVGQDINNDGIRDVFSMQDGGIVRCLNGFSSVTADPVWVQTFENFGFRPGSISPGTEMIAGLHLSGRQSSDVLFASGGDDRALYALSGDDGSLLWRWPSSQIANESGIISLLAGEDVDGEGTINPLALVSNGDSTFIVRFDGRTGRVSFYSPQVRGTGLVDIEDQTGDGVDEIALYDGGGRIVTVNGANGRTMRTFLTIPFSALAHVQRSAEGEPGLFLLAGTEGGITALNLLTGQPVWNIENAEEIGAIGVINCMDVIVIGEESIVVAGDNHGNLIQVNNPYDGGSAVGVNVSNSSIRLVTWAPPLHRGGSHTILGGDAEGRIVMIESGESEPLWRFVPQDEPGGVASLFAFDDIDLGGTDDVLALFDNGDILCISSGGDLSTPREQRHSVPTQHNVTALYPNPFNDRLTADVVLFQAVPLRITTFDQLGRRLGSVDYGIVNSGERKISIDRSHFAGASGPIYVKFEFGDKSKVMTSVYLR